MQILSKLWSNKWIRAGIITFALTFIPKLIQNLTGVKSLWAESLSDFFSILYAVLRASPLAFEALTVDSEFAKPKV